jgi:cytochrome c553
LENQKTYIITKSKNTKAYIMKIILSVALALFLFGCSDDSKARTAKEEIVKQVNETAEAASSGAKDVVEEVKKTTVVAVEQLKEASKDAVKQVKKEASKVATKAKETTVVAAQKIEEVGADMVEVVSKVEEKAKALASETPGEGAKVFAKCAGCHGTRGEKQALGKSLTIGGWDELKTMAALNGYKGGSYGGVMKGVMKSQVSKLSDSEIEDVAKYISGL